MNAGPLQSYIDKWLAAQPYQQQALMFVPPQRYPGHLALAALEHEWLATAYGIQEPAVAAAKLQWWLEELAEAGQTGGRHPLTQVLFDQDRARQISVEGWTAPVLAALEQLEQGSAGTYAAQRQAARPLHEALARLETLWWYGPRADHQRATELAISSHLLAQLSHLEQHHDRESLPLPMDRLARHQLSRPQLQQASPARNLAIGEQLQDLRGSVQTAWRQSAPISVFRWLQAAVDRQQLRAASKRPDHVAGLRQAIPATSLGRLYLGWQGARRWQRALA